MNAGMSTNKPIEPTDKQVATSSKHDGKSEEEIYYHPESKPVELLMNKTHLLQREKLCVQRKMPQRSQEGSPKITKKHSQAQMEETNRTADNVDPISYSSINHAIENEVTFDGELTALLNEIQLSNIELMSKYNVICPHLTDIFRSTFPECQIFSFGSTLAGLSFKECDLDIYMYLGTVGVPPYFSQPNTPQQLMTTVIFKKMKKIMYSMKLIFSDIIAIPKAKTPIIKFRYLPTNVYCDISFKNGLGVYKSYFLKYCALRDVRLKPLMLLTKYWAKHFGISGGGRFSNYGLVCLVIFYLQQVDLLPPLMELQKNCPPLIVNGWQVNFNEIPLSPSRNNSSIPELFHNFFSFYAEFNFRSCILCLLDGKVYPATDFVNLHQLPNYMQRYKNFVMENNNKKFYIDRPMCVQDPFELDQNTTAIISERVLIAFQYCCSFTVEICKSASENNYDNLLKILFDATPPTLSPPKKKKKKSYKSVISAGRFIKAGLPANFEQHTDIADKEQYMKENWYNLVFNLIKDVYEMVFKLHVEVILDHETKQKKIQALSDVHTRSNQKIMFNCTGNKCVWKNRKSNRTSLDVQLSPLEKEAIVSDRVLEQLDEQNNDTANTQLNFSCTLEKADPVAVIMTINDQNNKDKSVFQQFECFADNTISKIIEKTLLHMLQFHKTYSQLLQKQQPW